MIQTQNGLTQNYSDTKSPLLKATYMNDRPKIDCNLFPRASHQNLTGNHSSEVDKVDSVTSNQIHLLQKQQPIRLQLWPETQEAGARKVRAAHFGARQLDSPDSSRLVGRRAQTVSRAAESQ